MKEKTALLIFFIFLLISFPLCAGEELMSKLFFDKWLLNTTRPLERQIEHLADIYADLQADVQALREQLTTEIKVTIGGHIAFIDGRELQLETTPTIINGRTMVPVRFIGEALGASFLWEEKTRKVSYIYNDMLIEIFIDQKQALVNRQPIILDTAPFIVNGRTLVPLRFVSEQLGATVVWDEATRTVTITG